MGEIEEAHQHQQHHRRDDPELDDGDRALVPQDADRSAEAARRHFDSLSSAIWLAIVCSAACICESLDA